MKQKQMQNKNETYINENNHKKTQTPPSPRKLQALLHYLFKAHNVQHACVVNNQYLSDKLQ